jgi:heme-degrading monooxygenase HmoA
LTTNEESTVFIRISWGRVDPGKWDEYEAAYREGVAAAGRVQGLKGRIFSRDLDDPDTGYSISLWESAADMEAYEAGAAERDILPRIQPYFGGAFVTNRLEILLDERYDESGVDSARGASG